MVVGEPKRGVDVVLAEFDALRAEKVGYITGQAALTGLGLTALGVIGGFVAKEGHDQLLLAIPPIAMLIVLGHAAGSYRSTIIGNHIREKIWPYLEARVGKLPSWQDEVAKKRSKWTVIPKALFLDSPPVLFFIAASVYALWSVGGGDSSGGRMC